MGAKGATRRVRLLAVAHARSGDKGDTVNVGVIARRPEAYPFLKEVLTPERVKAHFAGLCKGEVERFEMENIGALNFLLHESLGGGGTQSLQTDAQGKTFAAAMLRMELDVPEELLAEKS
jgi:hypothetical protein